MVAAVVEVAAVADHELLPLLLELIFRYSEIEIVPEEYDGLMHGLLYGILHQRQKGNCHSFSKR